MGVAGGVIALVFAVIRKSLGESLDGVNKLVYGFWRHDGNHDPKPTIRNSTARALPYAPAIAIGALFSFFAR
jgi:prepilin peptidase CpaA